MPHPKRTGWKIKDPGPEDRRGIGRSGYLAPSWFDFTQRTWTKDDMVLTLKNHHQEYLGRSHLRYEVRIQRGADLLFSERSNDWQGLVRKAKQHR